MAAPAQSLLNCEQKTADSAELPPPGSGGGLKNGASGEELSADEIPAGVMVNNRVKSPSNASGHIGRELTMDNFQDGGTHQLNARPSAVAGDPAAFADRQRLGSDFRAYNPNLRDSVMGGEEFRNSPDGMNHVPVPGYGTGARGPRWGPWGGPQRPGAGSMMPCYPPSANGGGAPPQRFLSGPSLSQQGGPTPTLNQLLQSPNPLHRYQNSYGEYNSMHKGMADVGQQYSPWAGSRGSYPQQISAPMYRPPVGGSMHDPGGGGGAVPASAGAAPASGAASAGGPAAKRPYMGPAQYTQYQQRQPYPGQPRPPSQGYPQQQMSPYPTGPQPPPGQVGGPPPALACTVTSAAGEAHTTASSPGFGVAISGWWPRRSSISAGHAQLSLFGLRGLPAFFLVFGCGASLTTHVGLVVISVLLCRVHFVPVWRRSLPAADYCSHCTLGIAGVVFSGAVRGVASYRTRH
ncbi:hypothetical protein MTO96_049468 [Rhipicephalus appendiculatus]